MNRPRHGQRTAVSGAEKPPVLAQVAPPELAAAVLSGMVSAEPLLRDEKAMVPFLRYSVRIAPELVPAHQAEYALWDRVDRLAAYRTGTPLRPQPPGGSRPRRAR
ncbi:hypothetical protein ACFQ9Q_12105 [Streptomyces virginiae]|uniref:hypothetical protein n=1 Tax=Streptomyces virginiae TaxID=1961 RepID=UPI0036CDC8C2